MINMFTRFSKKDRSQRSQYFDTVYAENMFHGDESISGQGSSEKATRVVRKEITQIIKKYEIKTILDLPCGDLNWMRLLLEANKNILYTGADVSTEIIKKNLIKYPGLKFFCFDAVAEKIDRSYDLILCRDLLVHLPNAEILECIDNFKKSGSRWLLTTTFTRREKNPDLVYSKSIVEWRPINLEVEPFNLKNYEYLFMEECEEGDGEYSDKAIALYDLNTLNIV